MKNQSNEERKGKERKGEKNKVAIVEMMNEWMNAKPFTNLTIIIY